MLPDQTFAGRESNLRHAVKLSRVYADLVLALDKHRGKGEQKVSVEHVHVHKGGQAIVGTVQAGGGVPANSEDLPHAPALTYEPSEAMSSEIEAVREAVPIPAVKGFAVCRMHGAGGGPPKGNRNALKHGRYTAEALAERRWLRELLRESRELVAKV